MQVDITLKNYRCFQDMKPARISIREGFTAFVGVNNSGKSTLLRFFYEFRNLFGTLMSEHYLVDTLRGVSQELELVSVPDRDEVFCNANSRDLEIQFSFISFEELNGEVVPKDLIIKVSREHKNWRTKLRLSNGLEIENNNSLMFTPDRRLTVAGTATAKLDDIYPLFKTLTETLYVGPFRNITTHAGSPPYFDIHVGQSFVQLWKNFKAGTIRRNSKLILDLTKNIERIFGFSNLEIGTSERDETLQLFINGERYWLSEIGSGISQFIVVLANAAIKQPSYILIDEPELNLHPSLQLDFLTTLASYAREGVLFSTHSIGLARASAEQIYSLRKLEDGKSEVHLYDSTPRLSEFIGELNFSSYRELGVNKILLVEGRTDIKTVQQFLRKLKKDHEVLLLSLGGSDFINGSSTNELQEVWRISPNNVLALIDSERDSSDNPLSSDREAFVRNCRDIGINCYVLQRRATENYLSDEAVKRSKGDNFRALMPFEKLKKDAPSWNKAENWRIALEMSLEELMLTDLGKFLESI
jgi:predicted ATPase